MNKNPVEQIFTGFFILYRNGEFDKMSSRVPVGENEKA